MTQLATHHPGSNVLARGSTRLAKGTSTNVHPAERLASSLAGGLAVAWGLGQRSPAGKLTALLGGALLFRGTTGHCAVYHALGVDTSDTPARALRALSSQRRAHFDVIREVTIEATPEAIYQAWKRPETLRAVLAHIADVTQLDDGASRWTLRDPLGGEHAFVVEVVDDVPNQRIRFASRAPSSLLAHGQLALRDAPGDRGTEVRLHLHFNRPAGRLGDLVTKVLGGIPGAFCQRALNNLKSLLEAGELPTLNKNPAARPSAAR